MAQSLLTRILNLNNQINNMQSISIMSFEIEGPLIIGTYPLVMGNIYPWKGKIIAWAFNCIGANNDTNGYSSLDFDLYIDNINITSLTFTSEQKYDSIIKTGCSKGKLSNINVDFSNINLKYTGHNGASFAEDAKYRVSLYIQLLEDI